MGDLNSAYERHDVFEGGVLRTSYYFDTTAYDSLEDIATHVVRALEIPGVREFSLYRACLQTLVSKKREDYPELLKDCPSIHVRKNVLHVFNASGDEDDLLKLRRIIAEKMSV